LKPSSIGPWLRDSRRRRITATIPAAPNIAPNTVNKVILVTPSAAGRFCGDLERQRRNAIRVQSLQTAAFIEMS
jgi:hypothetical protein